MTADKDQSETPDPGSDQEAMEVIDRLYEVAVDPLRYEALLDHWEAMIAPRRRAANSMDAPLDNALPDLTQLHGHFERAEQVLDRVLAEAPAGGVNAVLDRIDLAASCAIDRSRRIMACNRAAQERFNIAPGDGIDALPLADGSVAELDRQVDRLLAGNQDGTMIIRVNRRDDDRITLMHLRVVRPEETAPYVLAISTDLHWPEGFNDLLVNAFGISGAETQIVKGLAEGQNLADLAKARGRSLATLRTQLKSIMAKTETRSQAELVRVTLSTLEIAQFTDDTAAPRPISKGSGSKGSAGLLPRPFQTLILPDGRRLDYIVLGDPTGRPMLYLPENYGMIRWPARAEADAARRGIAVIVPVRAGFGDSSPLPRRADAYAIAVADTLALLDHLNIDSLPILSLAGDSAIGFALGAAAPKRVRALVACSGVLPLTRPEQYERMDKWHRFILAGARYTPHLLPFMVKAGFALARRKGKRGFLQAVHSKSAADLNVIADDAVFEAMAVGTEVCLSDSRSAHVAFAREVIANQHPDRLAEVMACKGQFPVHLLWGAEDPQTKPETIAEQQQDHDWIDFRLVENSGQLLFFRHWDRALDLMSLYLDENQP